MGNAREQTVRKTVLLNPEKVQRLRELFGVKTDSQAVRWAIDETLAYREALEAARRIQKRGTFAREASRE